MIHIPEMESIIFSLVDLYGFSVCVWVVGMIQHWLLEIVVVVF